MDGMAGLVVMVLAVVVFLIVALVNAHEANKRVVRECNGLRERLAEKIDEEPARTALPRTALPCVLFRIGDVVEVELGERAMAHAAIVDFMEDDVKVRFLGASGDSGGFWRIGFDELRHVARPADGVLSALPDPDHGLDADDAARVAQGVDVRADDIVAGPPPRAEGEDGA